MRIEALEACHARLAAGSGQFRLSDGRDLILEVYYPFAGAVVGPDIILRTLQRIIAAASTRLPATHLLDTAFQLPCESAATDLAQSRRDDLLPLVSEFWDDRRGSTLVSMH
jgi:hypothetical protein